MRQLCLRISGKETVERLKKQMILSYTPMFRNEIGVVFVETALPVRRVKAIPGVLDVVISGASNSANVAPPKKNQRKRRKAPRDVFAVAPITNNRGVNSDGNDRRRLSKKAARRPSVTV